MEENIVIEDKNKEEGPRKQTALEVCSHILSIVFCPLGVSLVAFLWLFFFTYLYIMPIPYKLFVLSIVACFTLVVPSLFIFLYQVVNKRKLKDLEHRESRLIPYILGIMGYVTCFAVMYRMHIPRYMSGFILACIGCLLICMFLNFKWKISIHTAAFGLLTGGLLAYSSLLNFNPVGWLCILIFLSGLVGSARIILRQHTLYEVTVGFVIGMFCGVVGILFI